MRKWYREFFYVPKHEKVREKVMVTHLFSTVSVIVVCLLVMAFTAYAYFSHDVTSSASTLIAAKFEADVTIKIFRENGGAVDIVATANGNRMHKAELTAGEVYTVSVAPADTSTAKTGFIVITAEDGADTYHTRQIGVDEHAVGGRTDSITFKLSVTQDTTVSFLAHWGTSSYYDAYQNKGIDEAWYITQDETVTMQIQKVAVPTTSTTAVTTTTTAATTATVTDAAVTTTAEPTAATTTLAP